MKSPTHKCQHITFKNNNNHTSKKRFINNQFYSHQSKYTSTNNSQLNIIDMRLPHIKPQSQLLNSSYKPLLNSSYKPLLNSSYKSLIGNSYKPLINNVCYKQINDSYKPLVNNQYEALIIQLKSQIGQLLPLRGQLSNLVQYYEQTKYNYNQLLNSMQQQRYYMGLYNNTNQKGKQVNVNRQQLRQIQRQYEQLSDYMNMNMNMIYKLVRIRQQNKQLCNRFNNNEIKLDRQKQYFRNNILLNRQLINSQYQQIQKQLGQQQLIGYQLKQRINKLNIQTKQIQKCKQLAINELQYKKQQITKKYQLQSQLLSSILNQQLTSKSLINQQTHINTEYIKNTQINSQKLLYIKQLKQKINHIKHKTLLINNQFYSSTNQSIQLENQINQIQSQQLSKSSQLSSIKQQQIPQLQSQIISIKQNIYKSSQFLIYLQSYQQQLKSTSNIMFQQLNQSCQQDFLQLISKPLSNLNHHPSNNQLNHQPNYQPQYQPQYTSQYKPLNKSQYEHQNTVQQSTNYNKSILQPIQNLSYPYKSSSKYKFNSNNINQKYQNLTQSRNIFQSSINQQNNPIQQSIYCKTFNNSIF